MGNSPSVYVYGGMGFEGPDCAFANFSGGGASEVPLGMDGNATSCATAQDVDGPFNASNEVAPGVYLSACQGDDSYSSRTICIDQSVLASFNIIDANSLALGLGVIPIGDATTIKDYVLSGADEPSLALQVYSEGFEPSAGCRDSLFDENNRTYGTEIEFFRVNATTSCEQFFDEGRYVPPVPNGTSVSCDGECNTYDTGSFNYSTRVFLQSELLPIYEAAYASSESEEPNAAPSRHMSVLSSAAIAAACIALFQLV